MILLRKILTINIYLLLIVSGFEQQYLGDTFTFEQYNKMDLACDSKYCLRDAQILLLAATQNDTIKPCEKFDEFALGWFIEFGALNERYRAIGFDHDINSLSLERHRKVVAATIKSTDNRPMKIAKNFYQNCVTSGD